jgi:hypothetical protein
MSDKAAWHLCCVHACARCHGVNSENLAGGLKDRKWPGDCRLGRRNIEDGGGFVVVMVFEERSEMRLRRGVSLSPHLRRCASVLRSEACHFVTSITMSQLLKFKECLN